MKVIELMSKSHEVVAFAVYELIIPLSWAMVGA